MGLIGLVAIVGGSYLLRIQSASAGAFEPFRALAREPGARMMIGAALSFSLAAPFAKLSVQSANPYFAFNLMLAAYVSGIKGSNILMTALVGHLLFREKHLARSIAVGSLMVVGIVLLSFQS